MSSFLKKGIREAKVAKDKKVKKHVKAFYNIMGEMEILSKDLSNKYPEIEFTEDNINEYAQPIYGRELDGMEKFLVLGKLHHGKESDK